MSIENPGFWLRLMWAFRYFFLVLTSREFAHQVAIIDQRRQISASASASTQAPASSTSASPTSESGATSSSAPEVAPSQAAQQQLSEQPKVDASEPVLQLLGLLQQEARLVDFLQEDVTQYGDADIGAAARIVHSGCRKVLQQYVTLEPVMSQSEQSRVTLPESFDPSEVRLTGRVTGAGPFSGTLMHRGWRVNKVELPSLSAGHNVRILAPAEVEV